MSAPLHKGYLLDREPQGRTGSEFARVTGARGLQPGFKRSRNEHRLNGRPANSSSRRYIYLSLRMMNIDG